MTAPATIREFEERLAELAERIGLSPSPCLRRVRALEEHGLITQYRAVVDARARPAARDPVRGPGGGPPRGDAGTSAICAVRGNGVGDVARVKCAIGGLGKDLRALGLSRSLMWRPE